VTGNPTVFIGLDGAEPTCIARWAEEGALPTFRQLTRRGVVVDVEAPTGFGDGTAWPSLNMGVSPARHGRYFQRQLIPGTYERHVIDADDYLRFPPFWKPVSDAGQRVAILDLPYAQATPVNGRLLVDWMVHGRNGTTRGYPDGYAESVLRTLGDDPTGGNTDLLRAEGTPLEILCGLVRQRVDTKTRLAVDTLEGDQWDLLATSYTEPHDTGHNAWHMHDPEHPDYDPEWVKQHGDPIRQLYATIDDGLKQILDAAPHHANILVFCGLGMESNYTASGVLDRILSRLEHGRDPRKTPLARWRGWTTDPSPGQRIIRRIDGFFEKSDLARRSWFAVPHNDNSGAVRLNLRGREPSGIVEPRDYDRTCDLLEAQLLEIVNAETGAPLIRCVVRTHREFSGERLDTLPDLLLLWNRDSPIRSVHSPRIGQIDGVRSWGRTGDHTSNAVLYAAGPDITPPTRPARVVDIAPSIAALHGVAMEHSDGAALFVAGSD
jgi:predicted AlkP superfamily phosphohydrolase/phosphomutase